MRPELFLLGLLLLTPVLNVRAAEPPAAAGDEMEVVVGAGAFRLGPLKLGMTLAGLKKAVAAADLRLEKVPGPEGTELGAAILWKGTGRELQVVYDEESAGRELLQATVIGRDWKLPGGLRLGMGIEQVEKIHGRPFQVSGFGWDYAGWANFEGGGRLEQGFSIRFDPGVEADESLSGDQMIPSTNKKLRATRAKVVEICIHLTRPE